MSWISRFRKVFDALNEPLSVVLDASGCREGWLQGEMYRHLHPKHLSFGVNCYKYAGVRGTADLHCENPDPMVTELKIYGVSGYYQKNIDGNCNIDVYNARPGERVDITRKHIRRIKDGEGSLMKDYRRLRNVRGLLEKYLMLVIHLNGEPDYFGRALQAIRFSNAETTFKYPKSIVRLWQI